MNAVIDHHRSAFQRAKTPPTAGIPGWKLARDIQKKLLHPNCKKGVTVIHEVTRDECSEIEFREAVGWVRDNLNVLIDRIGSLNPHRTRDGRGFISVRRASKIREGTVDAA